jgi:hypothetical protein
MNSIEWAATGVPMTKIQAAHLMKSTGQAEVEGPMAKPTIQ